MNRQLTSALGLVIALAVTVVVYFPGLYGGYVFDDFPNIVNSAPIHLTNLSAPSLLNAAISSPSSDFYRPLASLSFALNWYFLGGSPFWMKAVNLCIHLLNGLLLYRMLFWLLRINARLTSNSGTDLKNITLLAGFVTAAWLLEPINLTAVLYVVQRMESLCQLFVLLGLLFYLKGRFNMIALPNQDSDFSLFAKACGGLLMCTLLGLLCKESAVLLPVYAFVAELCVLRFQNSKGGRDRRIYLFFLLILALPLLVGLCWLLPHVLSADAWAGRDFTLTQRLLTELRVLSNYIVMILAPSLHWLSLYHDDISPSQNFFVPSATALAGIFILSLLTASILSIKRRPLFSLGILWFFCAHLLTATIVPLELAYDHRNYFASIGILLALFYLILDDRRMVNSAAIRYVASIAILTFFSAITYLRAGEWSNPLRLALAEADRHPQSARANYAAAQILVSLSEFHPSPILDSAMNYLRRADAVPNASILAKQALIIIADRSGIANSQELWQPMIDQLTNSPVGEQDLAGLTALTDCQVKTLCKFDKASLQKAFDVALIKMHTPRMLAAYADFQSDLLHDNPKAELAMQEAILSAPKEAEYHFALAILYIQDDKLQLAKDEEIALKRMNHFGMLDEKIETLHHVIEARHPSSNQQNGPT